MPIWVGEGEAIRGADAKQDLFSFWASRGARALPLAGGQSVRGALLPGLSLGGAVQLVWMVGDVGLEVEVIDSRLWWCCSFLSTTGNEDSAEYSSFVEL